jgi:LacI family transcriptional regulator
MGKNYTTIEDIARKTGKSIATVSRVLNGIDQKGIPISSKTKEIVLSTARELGYVPNFAARALSLKNSMAIGLIIPDIMQLYFNELCYIISKLAAEKGYSIILSHSYEDSRAERKALEMLVSRRVNGIILAPCTGDKNMDMLKAIRKQQIPLILVDRYFKDFNQFNYVTTDDVEGCSQLVKHILDKGVQNILFIAGNPETSVSAERIEGYRKAFSDAGVKVAEENIIESSYFQEDGYRITLELIKSGRIKKAGALISVNDYVALGVLDALEENGVRIPDDIFTAGYGNNKFLKYFKTPLTTVNQHIESLAVSAFSQLIGLIEGRILTEKHIKVPCTLVARRSTGD